MYRGAKRKLLITGIVKGNGQKRKMRCTSGSFGRCNRLSILAMRAGNRESLLSNRRRS